MRLSQIMTQPVVTVRSDTAIKSAAELLLARGITGAPVVDGDDILIGIVSDADLIVLEVNLDPCAYARPMRRLRPEARTVGDVMSRDVIALPGDMDIGYAARLMLRDAVRRIPIVDGGRVVGIVTRRDLLELLARPDDEIQQELQELLDEETGTLGRLRATVKNGSVSLEGCPDGSLRRLAEHVALGVPGVIDVTFAEA